MFNSPVRNQVLPRMTKLTFPPHWFHGVPGDILWPHFPIFLIIPFRQQIRVSCRQIVITRKNSSRSTYRALCSLHPCFNKGPPLITAFSALPPHVLPWLDVDRIGSEFPISVWPFSRQFRTHRFKVIESFERQDTGAIRALASIRTSWKQHHPESTVYYVGTTQIQAPGVYEQCCFPYWPLHLLYILM